MADRVYPNSTKPTIPNDSTIKTPPFPVNKAQLYSKTRPAYRPQGRYRRRRSCLCSCCLWSTLIIIVLLLLSAAALAVLYVLYSPHRPSFSVTSLKLSYLNISSSSSQLKSRFDLNITAKNPNKKIIFIYNPFAISIFSNDVDVGDGVIPSFVHGKKNTTLLKTRIANSGKVLDGDLISALKSEMKRKTGLPLKVRLDTKVKVKVGGLKTPKIGIRVSCNGFTVKPPSGKTAASASTSKAKCKVDVRFKIWKWTI